jgi:hypothetical protein
MTRRLVELSRNLKANFETQVYVIKHGDFFTCHGFDVVTDYCNRYGQWLLDRGIDLRGRDNKFNDAEPGTLEHYKTYKAFLNEIRIYCTRENVKCDADLCKELIGLEGKRVEVIDCYGDKRRFKVGKSTGFIPVHLELARTASSGGPAVTGTPFKSVRVITK